MEVTLWAFWPCLLAFMAFEANCKILGPKELPVLVPKDFKMQDWSKLNRELTTNSSRPPWIQPRQERIHFSTGSWKFLKKKLVSKLILNEPD